LIKRVHDVAQEMESWRTSVPADCLFFDQLGARPWLRDFNRASPTPLAYDDGWLAAMAPYANRCLMVEDGWDRLARDLDLAKLQAMTVPATLSEVPALAAAI